MTFKLTEEILREHHACEEGIKMFKKVFPNGTSITLPALQRAHQADLDLIYLIKYFPQYCIAPDIRSFLEELEYTAELTIALEEEPNDRIRQLICQQSRGAYVYALKVDRKPRDDTRKAAILQNEPLSYALNVDKTARIDTYKATIDIDPTFNYMYLEQLGNPFFPENLNIETSQ